MKQDKEFCRTSTYNKIQREQNGYALFSDNKAFFPCRTNVEQRTTKRSTTYNNMFGNVRQKIRSVRQMSDNKIILDRIRSETPISRSTRKTMPEYNVIRMEYKEICSGIRQITHSGIVPWKLEYRSVLRIPLSCFRSALKRKERNLIYYVHGKQE